VYCVLARLSRCEIVLIAINNSPRTRRPRVCALLPLCLSDYRHQFYLHSRLELVDGRLKVPDWSSVARLVALIAQADAGDYDALSPPHALYSQCCHIQPAEPCEPKPQDFLLRIVQQHKEIKVRATNKHARRNPQVHAYDFRFSLPSA